MVEDQRDRTLDEIVAAMHSVGSWKPHGAVSLSGAPRHHIQKKSHASEQSVRTWPAPAGAGYASKGCLIRRVLSSSTRHREHKHDAPLWPRPRGSGDRRAPFAAWKTLTFVAALRCDRMSAPMMIKGNERRGVSCLYRAVSGAYPQTRDIVVMDNVPHTIDGTRAIEGVAQCCAICRPIRQTSIRSRWPTCVQGVPTKCANAPKPLTTPQFCNSSYSLCHFSHIIYQSV